MTLYFFVKDPIIKYFEPEKHLKDETNLRYFRYFKKVISYILFWEFIDLFCMILAFWTSFSDKILSILLGKNNKHTDFIDITKEN